MNQYPAPHFFKNLSFQNLHDPARYEAQIEKLFTKVKTRKGVGALFETEQEEVPLFSFGYDRAALARVLAEEVRKERYRYSPPQQFILLQKEKKKERIIFNFTPMDKIVIGVLSGFLTEMLRPFLSDRVYSYRKKKSSKEEVVDLSSFIQQRRRINPKQGFYLLQTDISSYSDKISVGDSSPFWQQFASYFERLNLEPSPYHWYLIKEAIRPTYRNLRGELQTNLFGLPTGSPIGPLLFNFYVAPIDTLLTRDPELFYGRYSDDITLCHTDKGKVEEAKSLLDAELQTLGLSLSAKKTLRTFFSSSGRGEGDPAWPGSNRVDLLGYSLDATGKYGISKQRQRRLFQKIAARIKNSSKLIEGESFEKRGFILCAVVNSFVRDLSLGNNMALTAIRFTNDGDQLKHLDLMIARKIAESVTGVKGIKAFRDAPYRMIRDFWGLKSFVQLRNEL